MFLKSALWYSASRDLLCTRNQIHMYRVENDSIKFCLIYRNLSMLLAFFWDQIDKALLGFGGISSGSLAYVQGFKANSSHESFSCLAGCFITSAYLQAVFFFYWCPWYQPDTALVHTRLSLLKQLWRMFFWMFWKPDENSSFLCHFQKIQRFCKSTAHPFSQFLQPPKITQEKDMLAKLVAGFGWMLVCHL